MSQPFRKRAKARGDSHDPGHPIPIGAAVSVIRLSTSARPFVEGYGVVKGVAAASHSYYVHFRGDPCWRVRVVHREFQSISEQVIGLPRDAWGEAGAVLAEIEDFFPEFNG